jgi:hypothetical protein
MQVGAKTAVSFWAPKNAWNGVRWEVNPEKTLERTPKVRDHHPTSHPTLLVTAATSSWTHGLDVVGTKVHH